MSFAWLFVWAAIATRASLLRSRAAQSMISLVFPEPGGALTTTSGSSARHCLEQGLADLVHARLNL